MSKEALKPEERKVKFSITVNPLLFNILNNSESNKSKYIEKLIYKDLLKNNKISKDIEL